MKKNMKGEDVFDLSDISDIPEGIRKELNTSKRVEFENRMIDLFLLANSELNIDQIQVGIYRKYGLEKKRTSIYSKLHKLCNSENPAVIKVKGKRGVYRIRRNYKR